MKIKYSDPRVQYGAVHNLLNRELAWDTYGIGAGNYGIDFLNLEGDELILDIGPGTGRDVAMMGQKLTKGGKVFAIDISKALLDITQQRASSMITTPLCTLASVEYLPFPNGHFDVVIAKRVLNHANNINQALSEISRVTKRKGTIIVTTGIKTPDNDLLRATHEKAIKRVGIDTIVRLSRSQFHCDNAREQLEKFFSEVQYHFYGFHIVFPDVNSFMLYYATLPSFQEATNDATIKDSLVSEIRNIIGQQVMPIVLDRSRGTLVCIKN